MEDKKKTELFKRLIAFSVMVMKFGDILTQNKIPRSVVDQLIRAATSVGANIVEAKSCGTRKDFIRFYEIALKSANETKYWLIVVKEYSPDSTINKQASDLLDECGQIAKIIARSILTMKGK